MGAFTVSFDFELGWGALETGLWKMREKKGIYTGLRPVIERITKLLDDLEISVTWATVGAMIDNPCDEDFEYLPEPFQHSLKEFLRAGEQQSRDGRDLLEMILSMSTRQDIGSHSYSHTRFQVKNFTDEAKTIEMSKSITALRNFDVDPKSFVFPVNQVASFNVLEASGISVARTPPPMPSTVAGKIVERSRGYTPTAKRTLQEGQLSIESGSMLYYWGLKRDWFLRRELIRQQIRTGLRKAANSNHHLHLWLHPFNLVEIPHLEAGLSEVFIKAAKLRDAEKLDIRPMSDPNKCYV